jgi:hypothetical protein
MYRKQFLSIFLVVFVSLSGYSQYNYTAGYDVVYNILNTKCSNAGCHNAASGQSLRFDTSAAAVYAEIYNQPPVNASALSRGEQLVWIDQPYQSYLLKKAGSWFDTDLALPGGEPDSAAHAGAGLSNSEVEYIRQWIMNGASQTAASIDTSIINAYYNDTARGPFSPKMPKPVTGTGIQLRYGPLFLRNTSGHNEVEELLMNQVNFASDMEVTGLNMEMNSFSHHFILFRFDDSASALAKQSGFREVTLSVGNTISPFDGNKSVCSVWVYSEDIELPTQTAFFWPKTTYLDLDFHVKNYSTYPVLPFDVYLNVAGTPRNIANNTIEMKSRLQNNTTLGTVDLNPPNNYNSIAPHTTSRCIDEDQDNGHDNIRYLWLLNSHTHKMGVGFNIYTYDQTQSHSLGDTVYIGRYDYNNQGGVVDLGYYDWEHPSIEYFPNLKPIDFHSSGLIAETFYKNDSSFYQRFGFTTAQEMQLFYYLYTSTTPVGWVNGVKNINSSSFDFNIYPNPMAGHGTMSYTLDAQATVHASITDITGKEIATLKNDEEQAGTYNIDLSEKQALSAGMYFARITVNETSYNKKFIVE